MKDVLGKGWSFPPHFNKYSGEVDIVSDTDEIEQSLNVLFSTKLGDRMFYPDFGCDLQTFQLKSLTVADTLELKRMIENAVTQYEPRIVIRDLAVDFSDSRDGILRVSLEYSLRDTSDSARVYPYIYENSI